MLYLCKMSFPIGMLTLSSDGRNLTGLGIEGQKYPVDAAGSIVPERSLPVFESTRRWLECYFSGKSPGFTPPLALEGSAFRRAVWDALLAIPFGELDTYGDIARRLQDRPGGKPASARAVGGAVGHNPISILIPCHRVVGSNGSLTGYGGGIDLKIKLLQIEKVSMEGLFVPKKGTAL